MKGIISALDCQVRFLFEKRTEAYKQYVDGASQDKIAYGGKNARQGRTCFDLERRVA